MLALLVETNKGIIINVPFVLLHSGAWVQGDVGEGSAVESLQYRLPLLGIVPPEAHLHGEVYLCALLDDTGNLLYDIRMCQDARAAPVLGLQGEGTAHVEVYVAIAQRLHLVDKEGELLQTLEDDLRRYVHAFVILRVDVTAVFGADVASLYTYERGVVTLDATNELVVDAAVHIIGVALQWGKVNRNHKMQNCEKVARIGNFL